MTEEKMRNRKIQDYSGRKFDPKIHEYQCEVCKLGFFVVEDFPKYIGINNVTTEVCPKCFAKWKGKPQGAEALK